MAKIKGVSFNFGANVRPKKTRNGKKRRSGDTEKIQAQEKIFSPRSPIPVSIIT